MVVVAGPSFGADGVLLSVALLFIFDCDLGLPAESPIVARLVWGVSFSPGSVEEDCSCAAIEFSDLAEIANDNAIASTLVSIGRRLFGGMVS